MNRRSRIFKDEEEFSPNKNRPDSEGHLWVELDKSRGSASSFNHEIDEEVLQSIRNKMGNKMFCGLPIYALPQTTSAMTYQSRKPIVETVIKINSSNDYWSTDHGSVASDELKPSTPSLLKKKSDGVRI